MYGVMGNLGPMWEALLEWTSLSTLLGILVLMLLLLLHVIVVRLVVRDVDRPGQLATIRGKGVFHPAIGQHEPRISRATASRSSVGRTAIARVGSTARQLGHHA